MTREEAKTEIMQIYGLLSEERKKALDIAIKALEQEPICPSHGIDCEDCPAYKPCEDAISRDAVWDVMQELWGTSGELLDRLMALPSIKPQEPCEDDHDGCKDCVYQANPEDAMPCCECKQNYMDKWKAKANKTGHWKRISMDKYTTHAKYWYRCDRCGKDTLGNTDWCPNCGAKMIDEQKSEDEE